jgi:N-acetyl sugar amidotransferase
MQQRVFSGEPERLERIVEKIKASGSNNEYDCIIGVSGGVDSTYVAYKVKELGLRPLAVHFDNGWNSELSVKNIEKTLNILDIDLYTYVIDWEEFKSLQIAFLRSSTPDGEIPTDHAITSLLYTIARDKGVKYIITGANIATEAILPETWSYGHMDWSYIKTINDRFGTRKKLSSYPHLTPLGYCYYTFIKGIRSIAILNYLNYDKAEAMKLLEEKLGWQYYGGKHYESIYTRFFQGYILTEKFRMDKRKAHLSTLILSGQLTREQALTELEKPAYPIDLLREDREYVMKKLSMSESDFQSVMEQPVKTFKDYPNQWKTHRKLKTILNAFRKKGYMYS